MKGKPIGGTMVFKFNKKEMAFRIVEAVFDVDTQNRLSISIKCAENRKYGFMSQPHLLLLKYQLNQKIKNDINLIIPDHSIRPNPEKEGALAYLYVGQSFLPRSLKIEFASGNSEERVASISFKTDDIDNYVRNSKICVVHATCKLQRERIRSKWIPEVGWSWPWDYDPTL